MAPRGRREADLCPMVKGELGRLAWRREQERALRFAACNVAVPLAPLPSDDEVIASIAPRPGLLKYRSGGCSPWDDSISRSPER